MKYIKIFQSVQEQAQYETLPCISTVGKNSSVIKHHRRPLFGGLEISQGPLYFDGTNYSLKDSWNYSSYNSVYGNNSGSYYFEYSDLGKMFSGDSNFILYDIDEDVEHIIYSTEYFDSIEDTEEIFDGWRIPTLSEMKMIIDYPLDNYWNNNVVIEYPGGDAERGSKSEEKSKFEQFIEEKKKAAEERESEEKKGETKGGEKISSAEDNNYNRPIRHGSTVNGFKHAICAPIQLTNVTYSDIQDPFGLLVFPDDCTITGCDLVINNMYYVNSNITINQLNEYLIQGCIFLPDMGVAFLDDDSELIENPKKGDTKSSTLSWEHYYICLWCENSNEFGAAQYYISIYTYNSETLDKGKQNANTEFSYPDYYSIWGNDDGSTGCYLPVRCVRGVSSVTGITQLQSQDIAS